MTILRRTHNEEHGVAMVTAILVSGVVLLLSISAVSLAIHNTTASGYDRRRLEAVDAAEAGVDCYFAVLGSYGFSQVPTLGQSGQPALPCGSSIVQSTCVLSGTSSATPSAAFTVTPTFYPTSTSSSGYACPASLLSSNPSGPWYVTLTSVGTVGGLTVPKRTIQARARLSSSGSGLVFPPVAMLGNISIGLNANVQVYGNGGNNADIYSNGSVNVTTQSSLQGNMYVQGTATIANGNFHLTGDLWSSSWSKISGGWIGGAAIASTSGTTSCSGGSPASICISGNTTVGALSGGGAKAGGPIGVRNPATVNGPLSPNTSGIGNPPTQTYPTYTFTAADWPGYVSATSCNNSGDATSIVSRINNWTSGNLYIRYSGNTAMCTLSLSPSTKAMPGNLAILTDGGITLPTPVKLTNGDATGASHSIYIFAGMTGTCGGFVANANSGIGSNLKTVIFTPQACTVTISSNSFNATGQIFSGTIQFNSNTTFTYAPVTLPSEGLASSGVLVDPVYRREITS
jgi:hypothetical protein